MNTNGPVLVVDDTPADLELLADNNGITLLVVEDEAESWEFKAQILGGSDYRGLQAGGVVSGCDDGVHPPAAD